MSLKPCANRLNFSLFFLFMLFFQFSFAQSDLSSFTSAVESKQNFIGKNLVVLVVHKDSLLLKKEFGEFNAKTQAPIASASKWLTAAVVMQFVDEGKIALDEPVSKYLPVFAKYGKSYITIRHCLAHLTGIETIPVKQRLFERHKYASLDEEINEFAAREIQANPGLEFRYDNIGLNIAARVLEVITKKKFDQVIQQKLFRPLGMRQTSFSSLDGTAPNPSGGARSSANDMMVFLQMLLNNGIHKGQNVLSEEAVLELRKIQTDASLIRSTPRSADGFNYASGSWVIEEAEKGVAGTLASPGLFGTWPMIDFCRGYAVIFFVKNFLGEQKADVYMQLKQELDLSFRNKCK